jgi:dTDP-4-dehydrorhamnose 3,5-epimerase
MPVRFNQLEIQGAWLIELEPVGDTRGSFARTFCASEFAAHGLAVEFPQHSVSRNSLKGTLRGMHFQAPPHAEAKLVSCRQGAIFDVCLDLRPGSPTFLRWCGFELNAENGRQLYLPKGCAHGFQTLTDDTEITYRISEYYHPASACGYRYDDPAFHISWPFAPSVMSEKDKSWPDFRA